MSLTEGSVLCARLGGHGSSLPSLPCIWGGPMCVQLKPSHMTSLCVLDSSWHCRGWVVRAGTRRKGQSDGLRERGHRDTDSHYDLSSEVSQHRFYHTLLIRVVTSPWAISGEGNFYLDSGLEECQTHSRIWDKTWGYPEPSLEKYKVLPSYDVVAASILGKAIDLWVI